VEVDTRLEEAILLGLSQRDYEREASQFIDLNGSDTVSPTLTECSIRW